MDGLTGALGDCGLVGGWGEAMQSRLDVVGRALGHQGLELLVVGRQVDFAVGLGRSAVGVTVAAGRLGAVIGLLLFPLRFM